MKNVVLALILLSLPIVVLSQGNKYGVFVGIGDYQDQSKLLSSKNDATDICKLFSANCGTGNTKLILENSATRQNILDAMNSYKDCATKGDTFMFYYSGHGTRYPDKFSLVLDEGKNGSDTALIPIDSKKVTSGKKWRNIILDDELFEIFTSYTDKGVRVIFISDSCFAGGLAKGGLNLDGSDINPKLGPAKTVSLKSAIGLSEDDLEKTEKPTTKSRPEKYDFNGSYLFIASSGKDESSYSQNPKGKENSLFTYSLIKFYKINNKLLISTIKNEVTDEVVKFATANNASQNPIIINFMNQEISNFSIF